MQTGLFDDQPVNLVDAVLHQKIRERLDPKKEFLSRDEIQKIIRMHHGNEASIVRQCLMGISLKAEEAGNMDVAVRFRRLLFAFESETFGLHDSDDLDESNETDEENS